MTVPDLQCFHIAFAVRDIEETIERWKKLFGPSSWHIWEARPNGTRPAYGRAAGQTWELWEAKGRGDSSFHEYLEKYGEGVQHIGFWVEDVRAAVEAALDGGARFQTASLDANGNLVAQLLPRADVGEEHLGKLGLTAFVDGGFGNVRVEYCGRTAEDFLRTTLGAQYQEIVVPPPWVLP
ncbi:MAG TPA: VOC family protein [Dehalococcoidia bacterium]|nr:VOC family protein [Dehalococcoidia bacterium]